MGFLLDEFDVGEYCKVKVSNCSDVCIICFSGFNTPKGKFNYIKTFSDNTYHQIYLNTSYDDYYHKGIEGLGDTLEDTIIALTKIIDNLPGKNIRVLTFGCSMGGYGALLYGSLLNVHQILALGPSIPEFSESFLGKKERSEHVEIYKNLEKKIITSKVEKLILHGDSTISDILTHQRLRFSNNSISKHLHGCTHALVVILASKMDLKQFIEDLDTALAHVENIFPSFNLPDEQYILLQGLFNPDNIDGILRASLKPKDIDSLHHTVLYCVAVSNIVSNPELAKTYFFLALEKHLHYRSVKRCYDLLSNISEYKSLLHKIESGIFHAGAEQLDNSEIVSLQNISKELTNKVYTKKDISSKFIEGYVDKYNGETLFGWCLDRNSCKQVDVDIFFGENAEPKDRLNCNSFRSDLKTAGKNEGNCSFSLSFSIYHPILKNSFPVYVVETTTAEHVNNSGMPILPPFIQFNVEMISDGNIYGWIYDKNYPANMIDMQVMSLQGNVEIERIPRSDLQSKGINPLAGFIIKSNKKTNTLDYVDIYISRNSFRVSKTIMV